MVSGAPEVAKFFMGRAQTARAVLVDGRVGVAVAPMGRLFLVFDVTIRDGRIAALDIIADPARLSGFNLALLPEPRL
jgi:RNA polymerase sigma-70 factor (ECF subfamily)